MSGLCYIISPCDVFFSSYSVCSVKCSRVTQVTASLRYARTLRSPAHGEALGWGTVQGASLSDAGGRISLGRAVLAESIAAICTPGSLNSNAPYLHHILVRLDLPPSPTEFLFV